MSSKSFFEIINNKILFVLTIFYIIIGIVSFKFHNMSWTPDKEKNDTLQCQLDNIHDEFRSTRNRPNNFFIKNKTFIYLLFGILGLVALTLTWIHNIILYSSGLETLKIGDPSSKNILTRILNLILNTGLSLAFIIIVLGLFSGSFYLFSYTPSVLTIFLNIINLLVISSVVALFYERLPKTNSSLSIGIILLLLFGLSGGWLSGIIFGAIGLILGYIIGKPKEKGLGRGIKKNSPISDFIYAALTGIPCIIINFASLFREIVLKEYSNDNNKNWWIIIGLIIFLLILKLIIPFLYKTSIKKTLPDKNILITDPISLNNYKSLGRFLSKNQEKENMHEKGYINYNYALSFWLWIFPESPSTSNAYNKSTSILNLSDIIKIEFNNNQIEFWATTTDNKNREKLVNVYKMDNFKFQKWNNIIINYYGGTLDIFINRKLVSSTPSIVPLKDNLAATTGSTNGIYGGIKNAVYYKDTLTQEQINIVNSLT